MPTTLINFNADSDYKEVADSIGDALQILQDVENSLSDGLQIGDAFVLMTNEDEVREIINDAPVFFAQFKQLSATTAKESLKEAGKRAIGTGKPVGKIVRFILNGLWGSATGYAAGIEIATIGLAQFEEKKALFAGADIFPGFLTDTPTA